MRQVQIYSRHGCHLCEQALETLELLQSELPFEIQEIFIDGDLELEYKYGDQVPVIQIDHVQHDFLSR